jgi:hypothetical protein
MGKECTIILKEDVLNILNNISEKLDMDENADDVLSDAIYKIENMEEYNLKELYKNANPIVDNLLVTNVKKGRLKNKGKGYKEALIRLYYTPAFPVMQIYFLKWVEWINKKGKQLKRKKEEDNNG